ncbi:lipopolysaccharide kinase InaA family protein [Halanaerobium sp. MA284_MarDTE_T2]|uniref:lipopolysaccharide kinase InaA family protein n=1 Tax=Halanaerobium sp. MA284_MarDTE_T2 TaxID=2183913 RepID=UPI000DF30DA6|nr:lipopolysaccharide kinase InaA family protein [Halanaerobium sp. MA284_MarDTE_T2]RCW45008.1 tRNA A-37 threonylcarbamoyl transferase component Bud32 [Halanaerobium sp. MA284_MarDTE_T2]
MSKNYSFISYKKDNIKLKVRENIDFNWINVFLENFCCKKEFDSSQILYDKRNTIIKINDIFLGKEITIKEFHINKKYDDLRFRVIPSKAERSLEIARALINLGLKTPAPIAVIEKRGDYRKLLFSYYISEYIDYDYNMLDIAKNYNHPERKKILSLMPQLGKEIRKMHDAGIVHNDLHAGNILVKENNGKSELYYIDLNRGRVKSNLSDKERINDLKRLKFTDREREILFKHYSPDRWKYFKEKVAEARRKRRKFVELKNRIRSIFNQ